MNDFALVPVEETGALDRPVVETAGSSVAEREKAQVQAKFLMALHRPRSVDTARLRILAACKRPRFASTARYAKPVGREKVVGFSIRFAEELARLWGNLDLSVLLVFDDDQRRVYRVTGVDLETNTSTSIDVSLEKFVERRQVRDGQTVISKRQNSQGQVVYRIEATEDDLMVKANALISKARRNVILALVPADIREEAEEAVVATLRDEEAKDPAGARKRIVDAFFTLGVMPEQLVELLGKSLEAVTPAELTLLRTCHTALREGEATWADLLEAYGKKAPAAKGAAGLREKLTKKPAPAPEPVPVAVEPEQDDLALDAQLAAEE